jgi:signal transduction histidine kinase/ligand-binding sensor domain-containing protein
VFVIPTAGSSRKWRFLAALALILACSAAPFPARAAWFTRTWQTDDGLPDNQVTAITQGQDGYLWVGTFTGLARFDGVHFTSFPYSISSSNEDQGVTQLLPAAGGGLWIRTHRGQIVRLNSDFLPASPAGGGLGNVRAISAVEDKTGCLWVVSADGIWQIKDGKTSRLTDYQGALAGGYPGNLAVDNDGNVWFAKGNGTFIFRHGKFELVAQTAYRAHLAPSQSKRIWIAAGKQLFKCDNTGLMQDCGRFSPADTHSGAKVVMEDHTGAVWIGSSDGLFRYTESGFEKIETSHPDILSLAEDREGNIWAGTAGGGLDRVNTRGVYLEGMKTNASLVAIQSICEDIHGVLWAANQNGSLLSRINGQWLPALTDAPWTNAVDCVAADKTGTLWIGTRNSGLYSWHDGAYENCNTNNGLDSRVILGLLPTKSGDLWIAGEARDNLQCLHNGQFRSPIMTRNNDHVAALAEDASGNIWAASQIGRLMRVVGDVLTNEASVKFTEPIQCFYPTSDGALWIGYEGGGLGRLKDGHFSQIGSAQGLFDDYISQIVADDQGWFWFGGEHGIFKVRRAELESALDGTINHVHSISYGQNEGLFSAEADSANINNFAFPQALRSHDGRLWIPLRKALAVVDPKILELNETPPPVLLTQVTVDGQTIASYGGMAATDAVCNLIAPDVSLHLPPDYRHLEFNFTAIKLSVPENVHFRYQLVGFDNDWIQAEEGRSASYSRLVAGKYQFRVQACIGSGPWSDSSATLALSVAPFFWETWWFRLAAILFFTSIVIAIARYISVRRLSAQMRLLEQRAAMDKERARIARDLHDDLGCSLNKVALTLDMTQRDLEGSKFINGKIEHCSSMVRDAAKSVDEIVWAINPRNDTLRYMVDYISQFAVEFLHSADIRCRVDLPDHLPERMVSAETRHNLLLVVKEALNNIARHAHASEARLRITSSENRIVITVEDNGRGFAALPDNASSDGLRNMRQRMDEIGGEFQLETKPEAGTRVIFAYSWHGKNGNDANHPNMP